MRRRLAAAPLALLLLLLASVHPAAAKAKPKKPAPIAFRLAKVAPQDGGEPSIATGPGRWVYVTYPGPGMAFYSSANAGRTWTKGGVADSSSGDDSVNVDAKGGVYQSNLNGNLGADAYRSQDHGTTWPVKGKTAATSDSSAMPFGVDRPWMDAYVPPGKTSAESLVYLNYHDFAPSQIWVNTSKDGGATFGLPVDVLATSPTAQAATLCNSSPAGIKVATGGPHAGRVYVAWLAADIATSVATGCNLTQLDTFHTVWIAWSDDQGATWTDHLVFDGGVTHDGAAFWGDLTLDRQGNPYVAFAMNLAPEWDVQLTASFDGGATWNGKTDGTGTPFKVNADTGTHVFPAIAAGAPGKVVVTWLGTDKVVPTLPYGKPAPGGDPSAQWRVYFAQTMNLRAAAPHWVQRTVTPKAMHIGDVCVYGLFCVFPNSDRNLLDFIDIAVDANGLAHIAYTDDHDRHCICVANQTSGAGIAR